MKWSTILICLLAADSLFSCRKSAAQEFSAGAGIYDFTDITAREFYLIGSGVFIGHDLWNSGNFNLHLSSGLVFSSTRYNSHRHLMYMLPLFLSLNYPLSGDIHRLRPVLSMGMSLMFKADQNRDLDKTHLAFTYGYLPGYGLWYRVNDRLKLTFFNSYNLLVPAVMEEVDMKGILLIFGIRYQLKAP
ncbi:MAG TPA: hypothetical protein P5531_01820 [Bacteroidales bacterium]|nr:hypothetical protein [Bacteroidales bacterium]HSA43033.1 hypothetical protein [Bacteroidales bacterium]